MAVEVGWSRLTYNTGAWNQSPDVAAVISGLQANTTINFGLGWSREEWNTGSWNEGLGNFVTGDGIIFVEDGQELTSTINTVSVTGSSPINISGEQLNISQGEETVTGTAPVTIIGEELLSATVNTFAVAAGGAITINTPTLEANVELNNDGIQVGTAQILSIDGQSLNTNLGVIDFRGDQILSITGESLTSTANTIIVSASASMNITGNGVTINLSNINVTTEQILSIIGNQANANVTTLKFWDPITGNVTEVWTNIH
jgi:hypothetical protein